MAVHTYMHTTLMLDLHTYIHACMQPTIRTYVPTYVQPCSHTYMRTYMQPYIRLVVEQMAPLLSVEDNTEKMNLHADNCEITQVVLQKYIRVIVI